MINLFKGKSTLATLSKGASSSMAIKVLGTALTFVSQIILARILGVKDFGNYIYVLSWVNILALVGKVGFDTATLRYVPSYKVEKQWGLLRGFLKRSHQITIFMSILVSIVTMIVLLSLNDLNGNLRATFFVALFIIPVYVTLQIRSARLQALKLIAQAQFPILIIRPLIIILGVLLIYFIIDINVSDYMAMMMNLIATFLSLCISLLLLVKLFPARIKISETKFATVEWGKVALPLFFISGIHLLLNHIDVLMIGSFMGTTESGLYSAASKIATLTLFGIQAVNSIAAPMISELYKQKKMKELQKMVFFASRGIFLVSFVASIILFFFGKTVLTFFGSEFIVAYVPLLILIIGTLCNACTGSVSFLLTMTGNQFYAGLILTSAVIINIVLNWILIPVAGIDGAAIATAFTMAYWNIFMFIVVKRKLNINSSIISMREKK